MKEKLYIAIVTCLAYRVDRELVKVISCLRGYLVLLFQLVIDLLFAFICEIRGCFAFLLSHSSPENGPFSAFVTH